MSHKGGKGKPKTPGSGRKKGTPNKNTIRVKDILETLKFEPIAELVKIVEACQFDNPLVCTKICLGLAEFVYPKLKSIEHSGEIRVPTEEPSAELVEKVKRLVAFQKR